jgi:hypothetical protein
MGKLNFDLDGNELPRAEGSRYLGGMVRPVTKEIRLDPKPAKILERLLLLLLRLRLLKYELVVAVPRKRGSDRGRRRACRSRRGMRRNPRERFDG